MLKSDVLIVGAGHGGAQAAIALRQRKFEGSITVISDEPDYPYERPALSKDYLSGDKQFERMMLRPERFWDDRQIELCLGNRVHHIDPTAHWVQLMNNQFHSYGHLIWAAGGTPRKLSCRGADSSGVHHVRNRGDVDRIIHELPDVTEVAVIGGGYIGLEAAAVLKGLGRQVVIFEAQDRVLARVAGEPISRFYESEHRAHGVDVRTGALVDSIECENDAASGVRLSDGELTLAQLIIVGIGINPNVEPLARAGALTSNGVKIDEYCRTSLPDVFAIGDCALHRNRYAHDAWIRLESVQNANDQAQTVARWITGEPHPYEAVPWFWSNQYDLKLQTVGLSIGFDRCIVRGDPEERTFSVVYLREGRVIALDCVNDVKDYAQGKALVQAGASISEDVLADRRIALKEML